LITAAVCADTFEAWLNSSIPIFVAAVRAARPATPAAASPALPRLLTLSPNVPAPDCALRNPACSLSVLAMKLEVHHDCGVGH
jgi:hypothetical protein